MGVHMHTYTHTYTITSMYYFVKLQFRCLCWEQGFADLPRSQRWASRQNRTSAGADTSQCRSQGSCISHVGMELDRQTFLQDDLHMVSDTSRANPILRWALAGCYCTRPAPGAIIFRAPMRLSLEAASAQNLTIHARRDAFDSSLEAVIDQSRLGLEAIPSVLGRNGF